MDVELEDGTIIQGVPEGTTKSQLMAKLQKKPAPAQPTEPSYYDRVGGVMANVGKGLIRGGPLGAAAAGVGEGMKTYGELVEKAGYGAGGAVTDIAAGQGASPEVAAGLGTATNVGVQALPMAAGYVGGKLGDILGKWSGRQLMQSAIKPIGVDAVSGKGAKAVETALQQGYNVSPRSMERATQGVRDVEASVKTILHNSPETIRKSRIASELLNLEKHIKEVQITPQKDLAVVERVVDDVLNNPHMPQNIPVARANELKSAIYRKLGNEAYGTGELLAAEKDALKLAARTTKEQIAAKFPEVEKLQKGEGELLNLLAVARNRAMQEGNKNPGGLAWLVNTPGAALGYFADRSSLFKSLLARMLYQSGGVAGAAGGGAVAAGLTDYMAEQ